MGDVTASSAIVPMGDLPIQDMLDYESVLPANYFNSLDPLVPYLKEVKSNYGDITSINKKQETWASRKEKGNRWNFVHPSDFICGKQYCWDSYLAPSVDGLCLG